MTCPACGSPLKPLPEAYAEAVRRVESDPGALGRLAPPASRTAIHGFVLALLAWIAALTPFFVTPAFGRATLTMTALALVWVGIFLRARRKDRTLQAAYGARKGCAACGWVG